MIETIDLVCQVCRKELPIPDEIMHSVENGDGFVCDRCFFLKAFEYWKQIADQRQELLQEERQRAVKFHSLYEYYLSKVDKQRELLKRYKELLFWVMSSNKGSIGSIDNVYLPQLDRDKIDAMFDELSELLNDE